MRLRVVGIRRNRLLHHLPELGELSLPDENLTKRIISDRGIRVQLDSFLVIGRRHAHIAL